MNKILPLLALSFISLTGCRTFVPPARERAVISPAETNKQVAVHHIDYDVTRRGAFVVQDSNGRVVTISEPAPDAGVESITSLLAKVSIEGVPAEAKADVTEKLTQFGTRTQMVMFLRESMFRLTEIGQNSNFTVKEYTEAYSKVIDTAFKLADTELQLAKAAAQQAEANASKAAAEKKNAEANQQVAEAQVKTAEATLQSAEAEKIKQRSILTEKIEKLSRENPKIFDRQDIMKEIMKE